MATTRRRTTAARSSNPTRRSAPRRTSRRRGSAVSISPEVVRVVFGLVLMLAGTAILIPLLFRGGALTDALLKTIAPWFGTPRWILPLLLLALGMEYVYRPKGSNTDAELTLVSSALAYVGLLGLVGLVAPGRGGEFGRWLAHSLSPLITSPGAGIVFTVLLAACTLVALNLSFRDAMAPFVNGLRKAGGVLFAPREPRPERAPAERSAGGGLSLFGRGRSNATETESKEAKDARSRRDTKARGDERSVSIPVAIPSQGPVSATFAPAASTLGTPATPIPGGPPTAAATATGTAGGSIRDGGSPRGGSDEGSGISGAGQVGTPQANGHRPGAALPGEAEPKPRPEYHLPPINLLEDIAPRNGDSTMDHQRNAAIIEAKLSSFNIPARVVAWNAGPVVTQYEIEPAPEIKVSRIEGLSDDLAMALAARTIRIEAPIPGKSVVGLEIPNKDFNIVALRRILEEVDFRASSKLTFALGRDVAGHARAADLGKMPHLLIAGATGSGKSVMVNALITSLLCNATPDEVNLVLVDLKRVELNAYNGLPHLKVPVITEPERAKAALKWAVSEMENRYRRFAGATARNIAGFNETRADPADRLPYLVIIIDELADLMMREGKNIEDPIVRLAQKARATGIHMVLATQRPSVNVVTGLIKANFPSRIAFAMASQIDSRTILDMPGAEDLIGRGDMLFQPADLPRPMRLQGVFVSDKEIANVTEHWRAEAEPHYDMGIIENDEEGPGSVDDLVDEEADRLLPDAVGVIQEYDRASASLLQRRLKIGYARAARIIDQLEARGYIGAFDGSNARQVLRRDVGTGPSSEPDEDEE